MTAFAFTADPLTAARGDLETTRSRLASLQAAIYIDGQLGAKLRDSYAEYLARDGAGQDRPPQP
jgi:hypothetical protein